MSKPKFDPSKSFKSLSKKSTPRFDPKRKFKNYGEGQKVDLDKPSPASQMVQGFGDVIKAGYDITQMPVKALTSAVDPESSLEEYGEGIMQEGTKAIAEAPTGKEAMANLGLSEEPIFPENYYVPDMLNPSPAGLVGGGLEMAGDVSSYLPTPIGSKTAKGATGAAARYFEKEGFESSIDAVRRMMTTANLNRGMNPREIGKTIFDEDLAKLLSNPNKLKEALRGTQKTKTKSLKVGDKTVRSFVGDKKTNGLIDKVRRDNDGLIIAAANQYPDAQIARGNIAMRSFNKIRQERMNPDSLMPYDEKVLDKVLSLLDQKLITGKGKPQDLLDLQDMLDLKKSANKILSDKDILSMSEDEKNLAKIVTKRIRESVDEAIKESLSGKQVKVFGETIEDGAMLFEINNDRLNKLIQMDELLKGVDVGKYDKPTLTKMLVSSGLLVGAAGGASAVYGAGAIKGVGAAALVEAARRAGQGIRKGNPAGRAGMMQTLKEGAEFMGEKVVDPALRMAPQAVREQVNSRSPQSIKPDVNFMVADTEIPRSTEYVMEHPNLTVSKVMQAAGPEEAAKVQMAIKKGNRRLLETTLPILAQQYPEIFEPDEYNSFDGKIIDPDQRARYSDSVYEREDISEYEKAEIIDHLNKKNEVLR